MDIKNHPVTKTLGVSGDSSSRDAVAALKTSYNN